ncbi:hypothetical protein Q0M10_14045, partial [Staphylococcus aureus]|nr:hypothetical protein [Staphylococcus aureus]
KPFLPAETQAKIKIWGNCWKDGKKTKVAEKLADELGAEHLPREYGGNCQCPEGCVPPLKPFPNHLNPPADLTLHQVKPGKTS